MVDLAFGEWLGDRLAERGLQQQELAHLLNVSPTTVNKWITGENRPRPEGCDKIAAILDIDRNEVRERAGRPKVVELAARFEFGAGVRGGVVVGGRADLTVKPKTGTQPVDMTYLLIVDTAAADTLRTAWGPGDLFPVPRRKLQGLSSPVLVVAKGDCMEPRDINDGDLVILDTDVEPKLGDIVAVRMGDASTLKEYSSIEGDEVVLRAAKPGYPPIRIKLSDQEAQLIGVVRGSFSWKNH